MKAIASTVIVCACIILAYFLLARPARHPLLIDAAARTHAAPNMLFMPCPLTPQNIPPRPSKETAA